jgi:hypothetical protein
VLFFFNFPSTENADYRFFWSTLMFQTTKTVVFIDANVTDVDYLVDGVMPGIFVQVLNPHQNGIAQISQHLKHFPAENVHIVSHGAPGCLYLGNAQLSLDTLEGYTNPLKEWFGKIQNPKSKIQDSPHHPTTSQPTLYLYGCNVAAGDAGAEFLAKLHALTGAAIAASTEKVGSADLGGNWSLDTSIAVPLLELAFAKSATLSYPGVFAPPTGANNTITLTEDTARTLTVSDFGYSDPEGDALSVVRIVTLPPSGTLTLGGVAVTAGQQISRSSIVGGSLVFTPDPDENNDTDTGSPTYASLTFDLSDGTGFSVSTYTMTFDVTPVNDAPEFATPTADPFVFNENYTGPITTLSATDADDTTLPSFSLGTDVDSQRFALNDNGDGTVSIALNTGIDFDADASANGDDIFTVTIIATDNDDGSVTTPQTINVSIQNVNEAPTGSVAVTSSTPGVFAQNETLTVDISALVDQDGGINPATVVYTWEKSTDGGSTWTTVKSSADATLALTQDEVDSTIRVVVTYDDNDGFANSVPSTATSAIANVNDDPVGPTTGTISNTQEDVGFTRSLSILVNGFTDTDSDTPVVDTTSLVVQSGPGSVTVNIGNGTFTYVPDADAFGSVTLSYNVIDGQGASIPVTRTFEVTSVNDQPTITLPDIQTVAEDPVTPLTFSTANGNAIGVSDVDGDNLTVTLTATAGTLSGVAGTGVTVTGNGTAEVTLTGSSTNIEAALGAGVTFTPTENFNSVVDGLAGIEVNASDGNLSNNGTAEIVVSSVADDPIINASFDQTSGFAQGSTLTWTGSLTDGDGIQDGSVTYTWQSSTNGTTWTTIGSGTAYTLTQTEVGKQIRLRINYTDIENRASQAFAVLAGGSPVANVNDAPTLTNNGFNPPNITEDPGAPSGTVNSFLVSSLVALGVNVTDADLSPSTGIALVGADSTNGTWHFSIDGGVTWTALASDVSQSNALLLNPAARLYFEPAADYVGSATVTFHAWDRTAGTNGSYFVITETGGSSPFSTASDTTTVTVNAVNDAPVHLFRSDILIPDEGNAETYPITNSVTGLTGNITDITVTLFGFSHENPDDLDIVLEGPNGETIVLMSDAGGSTNIDNLTLTFSANASAAISNNGPLTAGTFRPADYETGDNPLLNASLTVFNGLNPNADWKLYIVDDATGSKGSLEGYRLTITTDTGATGNFSVTNISETPSVYTIDEDEPLVFSYLEGNAITVEDVDAAGSDLTTTLTSTNGLLSVTPVTGATITGNGTNNLVVTGTVAEINAVLNGLTFTPADGFDGSANITIATSDVGSTGAGW